MVHRCQKKQEVISYGSSADMYSNNLKEVYKTITNLFSMNNEHLDDGKTGMSDMSETAPFIKE